MIASAGESLIDFMPVVAGGRLDGFRVHPAGSPCNVAVGIARLGHAAAYVGRLSTDLFGQLLAAHLAENGVATHLTVRAHEPTALAFVAERDGEAVYDFRLEDTATAALAPADLPAERFAGLETLHFGSLGLLLRPSREAVLRLARALRGRTLLSLDPNVRPTVLRDATGYPEALAEALRLADVVKASERDLQEMAGWGIRPEPAPGQALLVTAGAAGSRLRLDDRELVCPARSCRVVDTVGAGDAYTAGLLVALAERGVLERASLTSLTDAEWLDVMRFASVAAALTCERQGADPPRRAEVNAAVRAR